MGGVERNKTRNSIRIPPLSLGLCGCWQEGPGIQRFRSYPGLHTSSLQLSGWGCKSQGLLPVQVHLVGSGNTLVLGNGSLSCVPEKGQTCVSVQMLICIDEGFLQLTPGNLILEATQGFPCHSASPKGGTATLVSPDGSRTATFLGDLLRLAACWPRFPERPLWSTGCHRGWWPLGGSRAPPFLETLEASLRLSPSEQLLPRPIFLRRRLLPSTETFGGVLASAGRSQTDSGVGLGRG